jgi:hypothetical protein
MFYVTAYITAILAFLIVAAVAVDRWHRAYVSTQILLMPDFDEWKNLILSSSAAGADMRWQLEVVADLEECGYSWDADRLLRWMEEQ